MGVSFSRLYLDVDCESECYLRERGCFFEILLNLASFSCYYLTSYKYHMHL